MNAGEWSQWLLSLKAGDRLTVRNGWKMATATVSRVTERGHIVVVYDRPPHKSLTAIRFINGTCSPTGARLEPESLR
jgi:hypothetical protein